MDTKKILVVDDNASQRILLRKIFNREGFEVFVAEDGDQAFKIFKKNKIGIIVTDWLMPEMDGLELTQKIRLEFEEQPIIIVLTAVNSPEAKNKSLFAGADEYIAKPIEKNGLLSVIKNSINKKKSVPRLLKIDNTTSPKIMDYYCVGIAASTGGPSTLTDFFKNLGSIKNASFLVVQHGPVWMLESFVDSLQKITSMPVLLGEENLEVVPGIIYISPGKRHMVIDEETVTIRLLDTEPVNFVKPSADPLFKSIANVFGKKSIGIIFTGMGTDGSFGAGYVKAAGGKVFAQDPKTAVLQSMPDSIKKLKLADKIVSLEHMPNILKLELKN